MTDITLDRYLILGTSAQRLAFTPNPGVAPAAQFLLPIWLESDTGDAFYWDNTGTPGWVAWPGGGTALTALTGDVTATGPGSAAATIAANAVTTAKILNSAVTLAKIANQADLTILGNNTGGSAAPVALTAAQTRTVLGLAAVATSASAADLSTGTLPAARMPALTGDATTSAGAVATTLATVNANVGSFGDATHVAALTVNAKGLITAVSSVAISGGGGSSTIVNPQGRLTLVSNTPVMTADVTAASSVYYANYTGKYYPWYDGATWTMRSFGAQLTMALDTTNQLLNNVYDLFVWNDGGTDKIGAGPAWSNAATITVTIATPAVVSWTAHGLPEGAPVVFTNSGGALPTGITAGTTYFVGRSPATNTFNISTSVANAAAGTFVATSGSQSGTHTGTNHTTLRGTGGGTTELELKDGIWTNKNSITLKNGAGAGVTGVAANTATYVGSVYCTANGQTGMSFQPAAAAGGNNNILGVYNPYNRVMVRAKSRDSTVTWTYGTTTWRSANGNVTNRVSYLDGLAQSAPTATFNIYHTGNTSPFSGVNFNSTAATPDIATQDDGIGSTLTTTDAFSPRLGFNFLTPMESSSGTTVYYGVQSLSRQSNGFVVSVEM